MDSGSRGRGESLDKGEECLSRRWPCPPPFNSATCLPSKCGSARAWCVESRELGRAEWSETVSWERAACVEAKSKSERSRVCPAGGGDGAGAGVHRAIPWAHRFVGQFVASFQEGEALPCEMPSTVRVCDGSF